MALGSYRILLGMAMDSTLPRDYVYVTPHVSGTGDTAALNTLANGMVDRLRTYTTNASALTTCRIYQDGAPKPNYPVAAVTKGSVPATSSFPRELSLCLSFYATNNVKRRRGRMFLPWQWVYTGLGSSGSVGIRPTTAMQNGVLAFVTVVLQPIQAAGWNWVVRSDASADAFPVTNYFCDDEWDIQRRRGLRSTSRVTGTWP